MLVRRAATLVVLAGALLLPSGSASAESALGGKTRIAGDRTGYLDAAAAFDGSRACAFLTAGARRDLADLARQQGKRTCADVYERAGRLPPKFRSALRAELRRTELADVSVNGSKATVKLRGRRSERGTLKLVRVDDRWKMADVP